MICSFNIPRKHTTSGSQQVPRAKNAFPDASEGWPLRGVEGRGGARSGARPGSGRHKGLKKRRVESCLALDVNDLRRAGALVPGSCGTLSWQRDSASGELLLFRAGTDALIVSYLERGVMIEQRIALAYSGAKFGGARVHFVCPGAECGQRFSKLYFARGAFRCRDCHGLAYECQAEDRQRRARRRADRRRARLGSPQWRPGAVPVVTRPKGMWKKTFARLQERSVAADIIADVHLESNLMKIASRVKRRLRRRSQAFRTRSARG
jgi:hypothetical protein